MQQSAPTCFATVALTLDDLRGAPERGALGAGDVGGEVGVGVGPGGTEVSQLRDTITSD